MSIRKAIISHMAPLTSTSLAAVKNDDENMMKMVVKREGDEK